MKRSDTASGRIRKARRVGGLAPTMRGNSLAAHQLHKAILGKVVPDPIVAKAYALFRVAGRATGKRIAQPITPHIAWPLVQHWEATIADCDLYRARDLVASFDIGADNVTRAACYWYGKRHT